MSAKVCCKQERREWYLLWKGAFLNQLDDRWLTVLPFTQLSNESFLQLIGWTRRLLHCHHVTRSLWSLLLVLKQQEVWLKHHISFYLLNPCQTPPALRRSSLHSSSLPLVPQSEVAVDWNIYDSKLRKLHCSFRTSAWGWMCLMIKWMKHFNCCVHFAVLKLLDDLNQLK